jgi:hypothetical protein
MLPHLDKKRIQARVVVDYLENRITGNTAVRAFNSEHRKGKWSGKPRSVRMPWTREEGRRLAQQKANDATNRRYHKLLRLTNGAFQGIT